MNSQELRALQEAYNQVYDESYKDLGDKARNRGHQLLNKSKKTERLKKKNLLKINTNKMQICIKLCKQKNGSFLRYWL